MCVAWLLLPLPHWLQMLFTCGEDSFIRMWDVSDPTVPVLARAIHDSFRRTAAPVNAVAIHRNRLFCGTAGLKMFA